MEASKKQQKIQQKETKQQQKNQQLQEQTLQHQNRSKLFRFFNSPIPIIVVLILFSISLLIYNRYIASSVTLYNFGGSKDEYTIYSGTIYLGRDINYLGDSKINYTGKDINLYDFEIGYYIKNGETYEEISVTKPVEEMKEKGASLKTILSTIDFTFTEAHKDSKYFSETNIKNIKNLVFRIIGENKKGEAINIEIPLEVNKISK